MDLMQVVNDLIKFKTETGNTQEINKCFAYCSELFKGTSAIIKVFDEVTTAPVLSISNCETNDYDILVLGHLDVVLAPDNMFIPTIKNGKMFGRGTLDMKSFAAVAMNSMIYTLENKLNLKFGIIFSSDEEKGSKGTKAFLKANPEISAKIVLDNDVGGNIYEIISKCKNPVFVKLISKGLAAHGSTPWDGIDANENLLTTLANIRKIYPYFSTQTGMPKDTWIDTMHIAIMKGGEVSNVISDYAEALLDFRLTETSSLENLESNLQKCLVDGVSYEIASSSTPVVMSEENPDIQDYKKFAESILGKEIKFVQIGGATDAREFAAKGSTVIMHSGTGQGMHTLDEYVEIDSINQIANIQIKFLEKLAK